MIVRGTTGTYAMASDACMLLYGNCTCGLAEVSADVRKAFPVAAVPYLHVNNYLVPYVAKGGSCPIPRDASSESEVGSSVQ